jgi:hypothetical protein
LLLAILLLIAAFFADYRRHVIFTRRFSKLIPISVIATPMPLRH